MKKISIITLVLSFSITALADTSLRMLSFGSEMGPGITEPGIMGFGISPNGRYVCGSIEYAAGIFIGDLETNKMLYSISDSDTGAQLLNINNIGEAIGFDGDSGILFNIDEKETALRSSEKLSYIIGQDISDDGSVQVGMLVSDSFQTYPAYSKDGGIWEILPMPDIDLGYYNQKQVAARYVSSDGKIILGNIGTWGPATLWRLNETGEFIPDPIFDGYVMMSREDVEKPYFRFTPEGMSPDGHYILIEVCTYNDGASSLTMPAVYDTHTKVLKVYDEVQNIDYSESGLHPTAIDNNGTFIGMIGSGSFNMGAFIMYAGETQAQMYTEAFPEYADVFECLDLGGYHMPSDISADGRFILGNGWYTPSDDPMANDAIYYFMTYVIDTGNTNSVGNHNEETMPIVPTEYYTLDGIRVDNPVKGLNIIRMSNGTFRKILK
ncbi:MAG: hypothetical protein K2L17_02390 [Muribaculaceae bacterium]|nr:hypothetical protein [Muribaculaceae bacterium]